MYQSGIITFIFLGLITDKYNAGTEIKLKVNLIKQSGEIEDEITEIPCILLSDINPNEGESKQGSFNCRKEGLNEPYYSLRLNNSDSISSIPTDEILLDPILTDEAIEKKKILNYSITENQSEDKIPATFISKHIYVNNTFIIINGTLSKEIKNDIKFTLPLVYPDGASLTCSLTKKEGNIGVMSCLIDRKIENKPIIIEQTIIKDGLNEIINFGSIVSDNNITCSNGILAEAEKRANVYVSFRQVSHLEKNGNNGFSFFFASLISQKYSAGIKLNMKINILIGGIKEEKTSVCTLQKDVEPEEGKQIQGDFKCEVRVEENEYTQINFNNSESITISPDNEEITGSSELEEENISPIATDIAINETKVAQNNTDNNLTDLAECIDYYEEENKIYIPPSFQISSVENLDKCNTEGKFRIKGKFSSDINDQMTFMLPLTFPSSKVKCKVYETKAEEEVEIICKIQKGFKLVDTFVIEDRMIKKRHKEMIFIKNKNIPISESIECKDYNSIRLEKVKKKKTLNFSFLQLSKFKPVGKKAGFFLGITRKNKVQFEPIKVSIKVKTIKRLNNLRELQNDGTLEDISVNCNINITSETACGLDCLSDDASGTPTSMELNTDDIDITGVPDDADPSQLTNKLDYSNPDNLKLVDNLPIVNITSIDGSNCEQEGSYTIKGTIESGNLSNYSNVEIPFGFPDSSGLCDITVDNKEVTMKCQNKEKFDASSIILEPTVVQDSEGNHIFKLNNYYSNQKRFSCIISVNSVILNKEGEPTDNNIYNSQYFKKGTSGLSGGKIAAIVICCVLVLAIVAAIIIYSRSKSANKSEIEEVKGHSNISSSFGGLNFVAK